MKLNHSLLIALFFAGFSTASLANEKQTQAQAEDSYTIFFAMNFNKKGELDRFSIQAQNYSGDNFNEDMDEMCRGLMQDQRSEALIFEFKSSKNTDEVNAQLLPVPKHIEFQCLIP